MRDLATGSIAGILAGVAAGIWARLAMRSVALGIADSSMQVPEFTIPGTAAILISGAIAGAPFGVVHHLVSTSLPGPRRLRGLLFGVILLVALGPLFFTGIEEFFNEGRVLVFVGAFPVYGLALGLAAGASRRIADSLQGPPLFASVLFGALGAAVIASALPVLVARSIEIYGPAAVSLFMLAALTFVVVLAKRRLRPIPARAA